MATQNPIESEGTYPLPEAQIDRFMLKILIDYPEHDEELTIVQRQLVRAAGAARGALARRPARRCSAPSSTSTSTRRSSATRSPLATATRKPADVGLPELGEYIDFGASPRGPISITQAARALALIRGRDYATTDDVQAARRRTRCATGSC